MEPSSRGNDVSVPGMSGCAALPSTSNGGQIAEHEPVQALASGPSLAKVYSVHPEASVSTEPSVGSSRVPITGESSCAATVAANGNTDAAANKNKIARVVCRVI